MTESGQHKVHTRLIAIWRSSRPLLLDRLAVLERAAAAAAENHLDLTLRADATAIAHKLAGSLGMFGFSEGTRLAREIEITLTTESAGLGDLSLLTQELRREITAETSLPALTRS